MRSIPHRAVALAALAAIAYTASAGAHGAWAQGTRRLPKIAGELGVNFIVNVDGTVDVWGQTDSDSPYFGDGKQGGSYKTPTRLPGISDIADVSASFQWSMFLKRDGTVLVWGHNNSCELGVKDDRRRLTPIPMTGISNAVQILASDGFGAAVIGDGTVKVWGMSWLAGAADRECVIEPRTVPGLTDVTRIMIAAGNVFALRKDGTVWGWGGNQGGDLCDGTETKRTAPAPIKGLSHVVDIAAMDNPAFLLDDGTLWMCGTSIGGQMATVPEGLRPGPTKIPGVANVAGIASGTNIVRLKDGTLLGWGRGVHGGLGDGYVDKLWPQPHPPIGLGPVLVHYGASNSVVAIKSDGTVMGWGHYVGGDKEWALKPIPLFKVKLDQ